MTVAPSRAGVFPAHEEARSLVLSPESLVWRRFGDVRIYAGAGYALLLQVAHPTVGAGVREHSGFRQDPFGRLLRTMDYLNLMVYGGDEAIAVGRRLRDMHKPIRGRRPDGSAYSALEPEAYAWVHATLYAAAVAAHDRFIGPLSEAEHDRLYREFMPMGRLLGVREGDLPAERSGFSAYFEEIVATRLERTESVGDVLATLRRAPGAPPLGRAVRAAWPALRLPSSRAIHLATRGLLSAGMRERFGVEWSPRDDMALRSLAALSRASGPLLPASLRRIGPPYLRWRREEIAAGPLGGG